MKQFDSGATRSGDKDKLRYNRFMSFQVLKEYCEYLNKHRVDKTGNLRDPDNWKKGIPKQCYVNSLITHAFDLVRSYEGESVIDPDSGKVVSLVDLACAVMFNVHGLIYEILKEKQK